MDTAEKQTSKSWRISKGNFFYRRVETESYVKTYICGIRTRKRPANPCKFIDIRMNGLKTWLEKEINIINETLENKLLDIEKRIDYISLVLKEPRVVRENEFNVLAQNMEEQKKQILDSIQNLQKKAQTQYQELNFADLLHDSAGGSSWLKDKSFALYGWAANYSFIYTLFRILDNVRPAKILEMGLGQTSLVTSQYVAHNNPAAEVDIIENDASWINIYRPRLAAGENIRLNQCDIEFFDEEGQNRRYNRAALSQITADKKYNLIIVDGPMGGGQKYPRSNILDLVEKNLAPDFIIIFDDVERPGEQATIARTQDKLKTMGIAFATQQRDALKSQFLIFSQSYEFARYL